jgi:hypothetical protein
MAMDGGDPDRVSGRLSGGRGFRTWVRTRQAVVAMSFGPHDGYRQAGAAAGHLIVIGIVLPEAAEAIGDKRDRQAPDHSFAVAVVNRAHTSLREGMALHRCSRPQGGHGNSMSTSRQPPNRRSSGGCLGNPLRCHHSTQGTGFGPFIDPAHPPVALALARNPHNL